MNGNCIDIIAGNNCGSDETMTFPYQQYINTSNSFYPFIVPRFVLSFVVVSLDSLISATVVPDQTEYTLSVWAKPEGESCISTDDTESFNVVISGSKGGSTSQIIANVHCDIFITKKE